ncbi:hypothetical protein RHGRI_019700 [Rhododendron griersonianum]|uniref:Uncharacterized protein n=1 Tax=Rhododendron griersonianum TaxID=479676 RepID=A0AAV6JIV4_9ERIC|nr:hypothetical protein RHGRI_019700 [Rhododendron griersonianum]
MTRKAPVAQSLRVSPPIDLSYHLYILSVSTNIKPDLCVLEPLYKTIDVRIFIYPEKIIHDPFNHRKLLLLCVPTGNVSSSFIHHLYKREFPIGSTFVTGPFSSGKNFLIIFSLSVGLM